MIKTDYDIAIIGGGLAGLSLSIQMSQKGHSVILFEKETYPFHKVCGEYISMESWNFLQSLGLPLRQMNLPIINTLQLTAPNGKAFTTTLPLGGFGISRFLLDASLAAIAKQNGVCIAEKTKVESAIFENNFIIKYKTEDTPFEQVLSAKVCCAAWGKRSNLDVKWKRPFIALSNSKQSNYVGIKYHVKTCWKEGTIGLHNFEMGYCGLSKIEADIHCLCYMTNAQNLKKYKGNIKKMEEEVLYKNPHLKAIFESSTILKDFPVSISQINFSKKKAVENKVIMLGDAAGTIPPLCGNGMSMALHSSKLAAPLISSYLLGHISHTQMEENYTKSWNKNFAKRVRAGRLLQRFFGRTAATNLFVALFKTFPFVASAVIKKTHGKPF